MSAATRVRRHPFDVDESLADPYDTVRRARRGLPPRRWCRRCGTPGTPGDDRHTSVALDEYLRAWRESYAARTGERPDVDVAA